MSGKSILREALIALSLIAFGLFCLPALIFLVGQLLVGEYDGGLNGFYLALADALAAGNGFAWLLILSPYVTIQLARFWFALGRKRRPVTEVTDPASG